MMSERQFWTFIWLCLRVLWMNAPWWQAVPLTMWTLWRMSAARYLAI
jgi:hypothetical protein